MIHLAGQKYNAHEIIQNIFSPFIGVITSPLAEDLCRTNNLTFAELLQPFAKLQNDAYFRDVSGTCVSLRGLRLNFCDVDWRPPQTVLARKMLSESVNNVDMEQKKHINIGSLHLEVPASEPWFEQWRETFLSVQFPADHEFTRHFISCLIILSSEDPAIVETAQKLTKQVQQLQSVTPQKLPKWFHPPNVLNCYVILHQGSKGDISMSQHGYELLKSTFGESKCFLIQVNSKDKNVSENIVDYWSPFIKHQLKTDTTSTDEAKTLKMSTLPVLNAPEMEVDNFGGSESIENEENPILHPLSPMQEQTTGTLKSNFPPYDEGVALQASNLHDIKLSYGQCLNGADVENLKHFVQDYSVRALIPYVEGLVAILTETITNKKGVSKSLLSATKRWFATNKPIANSGSNSAVIYTHESSELQTRKLGDLYFMFRHYGLAFQAYHLAKRDFNADSAWSYYAGALEMAAISAFMLGTSNRKTYDYMEDAITCYLNTCRLQQFATRATLLSMECLRSANLYGEAAKQLMRMTSEDSDLRSALLLEQASYCFLATQPPMYRKYAFNIVLSGNRYSRASQRKHTYRCYKQAYQVFQGRGWSLAEDHIQYTIAKQAILLKKLAKASQLLANLLRPDSLQSTQQQYIFLKEFFQAQNELHNNFNSDLQELVLPQIIQNSLRVLTLSTSPLAGNPHYIPASNIDIKCNPKDELIWQKIEEMIVMKVLPNKAFVFKPSCYFFSKDTPTAQKPLAVQGDPIEIAVTVLNPTQCRIILTDINIVWKLGLDNGDEMSNLCLYESKSEGSKASNAAINAAIKMSLQNCELNESSEETLYFKLTPKVTGTLNIIGLVCRVATTVDPLLSLLGLLKFKPQKLKQIGKNNIEPVNDNKLSIQILPQVPSLAVSFSEVPTTLFMGEIIPVTIVLSNSGIYPIEEVFMGCDAPRWITFAEKQVKTLSSTINAFGNHSEERLIANTQTMKQQVFQLLGHKSSDSIKAQETTTIQMWIQAPYKKGDFELRLLFYYGLPNELGKSLKYRLVRHMWKFHIQNSLQTEATCAISNFTTGDHMLSIKVKNEIEDPLLNIEFSIDSFSLYSARQKLYKNIYYTDKMELEKSQADGCYLKNLKSVNCQCNLKNIDTSQTKTVESLEKQLSTLSISTKESNVEQPPEEITSSFLIKNEALSSNSFSNTDEINNVDTFQNMQETVVVGWSARLLEGRKIVGRHFINLRNVFDVMSCPQTLHETVQTNSFKLSDFQQTLFDKENENNEFQSFAENSFPFVANRCLLDDSTFLLTAKS